MKGRYSKISRSESNATEVLASSVRAVLGVPKSKLTDVDAVKLVLSPLENKHLTSTLNETTLRSSFEISFPGSLYLQEKNFPYQIAGIKDIEWFPVRPVLLAQYAGKPDYITPVVIEKYPVLFDEYTKRMNGILNIKTAF